MAQSVYSPKDVDISIAGFNISGWDSVTLSRNTENTGKNISADGRLGLTYSADVTGSAEIEVQQHNSPVNAYMAALQGAQDAQQAPIFFDLTVSDKSGGVLAYAKECFLDMPASQDLATEAQSRTWMLYVSNLVYVPNPNGADIAGAAEAVAAANTVLTNAKNLGVISS